MTAAIELEQVDKSYGRHQVLRGLDLCVPERSVFAFLGNNGHGKSTTIRLITGLGAPDRGSIRVLGHDVSRARRPALAQMGCLIEAPSSYPNLTASEFLSIGTRLKALPASEIGRVLEVVGLRPDPRQRIEHFSLGMKQRLALAHALLGSPRLLVLDEPTNGLDPSGMQDIRRLISTLPETADCTIFFASHLLAEVERTATHLAVIRDGAIQLQSSVRELESRLTGALALEVGDAPLGAKTLQGEGFTATAEGPHQLLVSNIERDQAGRVHSLLVHAGVVLYQSALRKPTLEQWFLGTADAGREAA
jgi:ABC-type multidrug transport system ATPase subunit